MLYRFDVPNSLYNFLGLATVVQASLVRGLTAYFKYIDFST